MKKKKISKVMKKMDSREKIFSKFTTGRSKSIKKRKNTLLLEYKLLNKNNKFTDRRIGEKNRNMTAEDRVMARFVAQRMKTHRKNQLFNLDDDEEVLTHHGRTIEHIQKYDSVHSDDEEEDAGNLDAKFVENAHFGGGLFTKSSGHKNTIDELIAESKRRKAERQLVKDETVTLTEKLDKDLKEIFPTINSKRDHEDETYTRPVPESYDVLVRQLKFEAVSKPTTQPKTEIDNTKMIACKEREREERMKCGVDFEKEDEDEVPAKHRSADDLDDGLDLDDFDMFNEEGDDNDDEEEGGNVDEEEEEGGGEEVEEEETREMDTNDEEDVGNEKVVKINRQACIVPQTVDELLQKLNGKNAADRIGIIKNLIRSQKVHVGVSVKQFLINFFKVLVNYVFLTIKEKDSWDFVNQLSPVLFELTQVSGDDIGNFIISLLKEKYDSCSEDKFEVEEDTLILLKLIPLLFPTSDYYHPVTTPAAVFISRILHENSCKSLKCIAKGLFLSTVMLEFVHLSKRYSPETMNFLCNVLYTAVPNFEDAYPPVSMKNKILVMKNKHKKDKISDDRLKLSFSLFLEDVGEDDENKITVLFTTLRILNAYSQLYDAFSATRVIWLPIENLLKMLPMETLPPCIRSQIQELRSRIETISNKPMKYLVEKKRTKMLRLYEPNIRPVIDGKSFRTVSQANLEKEKLIRQYKKEKRGAYKEIRKDQKLLTRVMVVEQAKKDAERKEKVKQIFNWGQNQQSEFKRMERKNRFRR